jgi:disulfide oxidoreductase YuzD
MARKKSKTPRWLKAVEGHDYDAAVSYLSLVYPSLQAAKLVAALRRRPLEQFKAKDIFRASRLSLLGVSNSHVDKDIKKIKRGIGVSPLLLVRDQQTSTVVIADGYHRLCAVYQFDEDALIPCKIV